MTKLLLITNYFLLTTLYYVCSFIYRLKSLHSLAEHNDVNVHACPTILIVNSTVDSYYRAHLFTFS